MSDLSWSFAGVWNKSLEKGRDSKKREPRENIWASELDKALVDVFLKLKGIAPTNPPDNRALRKFEAGNMMEWIVEMVLRRAGICKDTQAWLSHQYPGLLKVTGKVDFFAGGKPDWEKAKAEIRGLRLPEFFARGTEAIIKHFSEKYPDGLKDIAMEVKSCSVFMFEKYEKFGPGKGHVLQDFHYIKSAQMPEGRVVYISRDDLRMLEFAVLNPSPVEDDYRNRIRLITNYHKADERPPLEKEILFNKDEGRVSKNWRIEYSDYLTMLYGYKTPAEYKGKVTSEVAAINRVLTRLKKKQKITDNNREKLVKLSEIVPELKGAGKPTDEELYKWAGRWSKVESEKKAEEEVK